MNHGPVECEDGIVHTGTTDIANFAVDIVDRAADDPAKVALRWRKTGGVSSDVTFLDLKIRSEKVAHVLYGHGVRPGHRVYILLPPCVAWWESVLGCMRAGAVAVLGQDASNGRVLGEQIAHSGSGVVIAAVTLADTMDRILDQCPHIAHRFAVGWEREGWVDYDRRVSLAPAGFKGTATRGTDPCIVIYDQEPATIATTYLHGDASFDLDQLDAWRDGLAIAVHDASGHP